MTAPTATLDGMADLAAVLASRTLTSPHADGCWTWTGRPNSGGYGRLRVDGRVEYAHRAAYELAHGPIPDGAVIDHLCHEPANCEGGPRCPHRLCVRPDHLTATTSEQNTGRGRTTSGHYRPDNRCPKGHLVEGANAELKGNGYTACRRCHIDRATAWNRAHRNLGGAPVRIDP